MDRPMSGAESTRPRAGRNASRARRRRAETGLYGRGGGQADRVLGVVLPGLTLIALFAFWQFFVIWRNIPRFIFPRFDDTLLSLRDNWTGTIGPNLLITLEEAGIGFVIGNALAILGATLFVASRLTERTFFPLAVLIQTVPIIVWSPILVITMPTDSLYPQVVIAVLISFFPALVTMTRGLRAVDPLELELFHVLNASRWQVYRKLRWPAAIPSLFASLRITSTLSLIGAIVGDYAGGGQGLGYQLIAAEHNTDTAPVMAITLVATFSGIVVFLVVAAIERVVLGRRGETA